MKALIALLLALSLSGCAMQPLDYAETTGAMTAMPETTQSQEIVKGAYLPDSAVEKATDGAIHAYSTGVTECVSLFIMGNHLLLQSGYDSSKLTLFTGENLILEGQKELHCVLQPVSGGIQVTDDSIAYYDEQQRAVIFLNNTLEPVRSVKMPDDMTGNVLIAPEQDRVYYCTESAVNVMNLHSGLSRLLKEQPAQAINLTGLYFEGQVLSCCIQGENGAEKTVYFSSETGETLYDGSVALCALETAGQTYVTTVTEGLATFWLIGERELETCTVSLPDLQAVHLLADSSCVAVEETQDRLWLLSAGSGVVLADAEVPMAGGILDAVGDNRQVWLLTENEEQQILHWSVAENRMTAGTCCFQHYYTPDAPDVDGLRICQEKADTLGEKYGVTVRLWESVLDSQPADYTYTLEYQTLAYEQALLKLNGVLAQYPDGFFKKAASGSKNGTLTINLVRALSGGADTQEDTLGLQYWQDGSAYITLVAGNRLEQTFYHELCHLIDNRVIGTTLAYDDWERLNPTGFSYDYSYEKNRQREDELQMGEDRAFVDTYSMSYPNEDRARIMEYAMLTGQDAVFASETMQNKLRTICWGIREAFELEEGISYLWEQYLHPAEGESTE